MCMHIHVCKHVDEALRQVVWHKVRHKVWVFMATNRLGLAAAMPSAQKGSEQQCRGQAITPRLSGRAARWCTNMES
jgi:hypothetical protein